VEGSNESRFIYLLCRSRSFLPLFCFAPTLSPSFFSSHLPLHHFVSSHFCSCWSFSFPCVVREEFDYLHPPFSIDSSRARPFLEQTKLPVVDKLELRSHKNLVTHFDLGGCMLTSVLANQAGVKVMKCYDRFDTEFWVSSSPPPSPPSRIHLLLPLSSRESIRDGNSPRTLSRRGSPAVGFLLHRLRSDEVFPSDLKLSVVRFLFELPFRRVEVRRKRIRWRDVSPSSEGLEDRSPKNSSSVDSSQVRTLETKRERETLTFTNSLIDPPHTPAISLHTDVIPTSPTFQFLIVCLSNSRIPSSSAGFPASSLAGIEIRSTSRC